MSLSKILTITVITILLPISASAQNACGKVITMDRAGEAESYCSDMYDRQFEYREQRIEFRKAIEERRDDYMKPAAEARKKYEKDLAKLNSERSHENDLLGR